MTRTALSHASGLYMHRPVDDLRRLYGRRIPAQRELESAGRARDAGLDGVGDRSDV